jgi:uncharacterized membrane protein
MATATNLSRPHLATPSPVRPTKNKLPAITTPPNVSDVERWASLIGGAALTAYGLKRMSLSGLFLAICGGGFVYRGITGHCPCYAALGINTAKPKAPATSVPAGHGNKVERSITINRSPEELYRFWRRFENLPRIMHHLESVTSTGNRSHWVARAPLGMTVEWDAEIITERPNELIGWRSLEGSGVDTAGSVHFTPAPGERGTEVRVILKYDPPGGRTATEVAHMFGADADWYISEDLRHLKELMEAGEIATTQGQSSCRPGSKP